MQNAQGESGNQGRKKIERGRLHTGNKRVNVENSAFPRPGEATGTGGGNTTQVGMQWWRDRIGRCGRLEKEN